MTDKLNYTILRDGYKFTRGNPNIVTFLDGGQPRIRRDVIGQDHSADIQFALFDTEYDDFMDFYNDDLVEGSLPFLLDIPGPFRIPVQHKCKFVTALEDSGVIGLMHYVKCSVSIQQNLYVRQNVRFVHNGSTQRILPVSTYPASVTDLFAVSDNIQIIDGFGSDGAFIEPDVNLNGIYSINTINSTEIRLASALAIAPDWAFVENYEFGTTDFAVRNLIKVPT